MYVYLYVLLIIATPLACVPLLHSIFYIHCCNISHACFSTKFSHILAVSTAFSVRLRSNNSSHFFWCNKIYSSTQFAVVPSCCCCMTFVMLHYRSTLSANNIQLFLRVNVVLLLFFLTLFRHSVTHCLLMLFLFRLLLL